TGQDDAIVDGNISYTIQTTSTSTDVNFEGLTSTSTPLTNLDNDVANISINDVSVVEGNNGTTTLVFTVSLSTSSTSPITVDYSTANGSATTGDNDYTAIANTLTFLAGETSKTVTVTINGDNYFENSETLTVNLSNAVGGTITDSSGTGTITNDDAAPSIIIVPTTADVTTSEGGDTTTFDITLSSAPRDPVTVTIVTSDPTEGTPSTTTLTFDSSNWNIPQTVTITGQDDAIVDGNISYTIQTTSTSSDTNFNGLTSTSTPLTNLDNDVVNISINDVSVVEGNNGTTTLVFTVSLSNVSTSTVTVNYTTADDTATTGDNDYTAIANTLTFLAGETSKTVTVTINGDNYFENSETLTVNLSNAVGGTITDASGTGTITNDDAAPSINIVPTTADVTTSEGGDTTTFDITLSSAPRDPVTVTIVTSDPTEGTPGTTTLTFDSSNWNIPQTVTITGQDDAIVDGNISYTIQTTSTSSDTNFNGLISTSTPLTNLDNDVANISINDVSVVEGNNGTTTLVFTVSLSTSSTSPITVDYSTANGSATTGDNDYTAIANTLTFLAGETSKMVTVTIHGDNYFENNETLTVNLANAVGGTITDASGTGTITNDDAAPSIIIVPTTADVTTSEGSDTTTFDITLSSAPRDPVTVTIVTSDPTEGTPSTTTLTFDSSNWDIPQTVTITGQDDAIVDGNISYTIQTTSTSSDTNFNGLTSTSTPLTNLDNDVANISINDVSVVEGNNGTTTLVFTVSLSNVSTSTVTVNYTTADGTATTGDNDYTAIANTLTFLAGETSKTVTVTINGDNYFENDETLTVNLSNAIGGTITDASGLGTITNDEAAGALIITSTDSTTSESGGTGSFTVELPNAPRSPVTITFTSTDPTEGTVTNTTLVFDDSNWNIPQTVTVQGLDDSVIDGTVSYQITGTVSSSDPNYNGQITTPVIFQNTDNDVPNISISDVTVTEGNSGSTTMTFTVTLDTAGLSTVTVDYQTLNGTATTTDNDYTGIPLSTLQFLAGETTKQITVTIHGDNFFENNENLSLVLSNAVGGVILDNSGLGTINNDDAVGGLILIGPPADTTTGENGDQGSFTVALTSAPRDTVTVTFTSSDPGEGTPVLTTITFNSTNWNIPQTVLINGVDDTIVDGNIAYSILSQITSNDANFNNTLFAPINFTNADNDVSTIGVSDITIVENGNGTTTGTFVVTLSNSNSSIVTVNYNVNDNTATLSDSDYQPVAPGVLIFAPGETSKTVTVVINGDYYYESNETMTLTLTNALNSILGDDTAIATIINDDAVPDVIVTPIDTVINPDSPEGMVILTITSKPRDPVTVYLNTTDPTQGIPQVDSVIFDDTNWQDPIYVTILGNGTQTDTDSTRTFNITTTVVSSDPFYGQLPPDEIPFLNVSPGIPTEPTQTIVATPPSPSTDVDFSSLMDRNNINHLGNNKVISFDSLVYSSLDADLSKRYDFFSLDNSTYEFYGFRDINDLERGYLFDRSENDTIAPLWGIDGTQGRLFAFKDPNNLMGSYISYGDLYYDDPKEGVIKVGGNISSFAIDGDNIAYIVINGDVGTEEGSVLAKIDLNNLSKESNQITIVGAINGKAITGIAFDKESGYLYGIERQAGADVLKIYNRDNGYSIEIGTLRDKNNVNFRADDLKFDTDGELYATGPDEQLFFINRASGTAVPVQDQGNAHRTTALAWDKSNDVFMVVGDDSVSYYHNSALNHEVEFNPKALGLQSIDGLNFINN
ncbi:MAG: Calx-beta domain-containing protein, partial [Parachlamydiales bacterium]